MGAPRSDVCLVCGAERTFDHWHQGVFRCRVCNFLTCLDLPLPQEVSELYSEPYFRGAEYFDYLEVNRGIRRSLARRLNDVLAVASGGGSLLEVGCAYGYFLDLCRNDFEPAVGVDIAAGAVAHARQVLGLDARCVELPDLELPAGWAGTVCMWDTIEHLADPAAYLEATFRLLDPGGWLFLTTGDVGAMVARLRGRRWRQIHPSTHLHYFSRATMTRLLTRIGFSRPRFKTAGNVHTVDSILYNLKLRRHPLGRLSDVAWVNRTFGSIEITINLGDTMLVAARKPQEPHRGGRDATR